MLLDQIEYNGEYIVRNVDDEPDERENMKKGINREIYGQTPCAIYP